MQVPPEHTGKVSDFKGQKPAGGTLSQRWLRVLVKAQKKKKITMVYL